MTITQEYIIEKAKEAYKLSNKLKTNTLVAIKDRGDVIILTENDICKADYDFYILADYFFDEFLELTDKEIEEDIVIQLNYISLQQIYIAKR